MEVSTSPQMSVNTHVTRCAAETLPFTVGDMLLCLGISILLRHAKIDNVYH